MKIAAMVGAPDLNQETTAVYCGDLEQAMTRLSELGYDGIEIMVKDTQTLDGPWLRRRLERHGLELVGLCTGHVYGEDRIGLVEPEPEVRRRAMTRLKQFVDFSSTWFEGRPLVTIGRSRGMGYPEDPIRTWSDMVSAFGELADYALGKNVHLVVEPINIHQATTIHTTQEGIAMVRQVNRPNFGLMLDVYHMNIEDIDVFASIREAGESIWFVHFCDNNRKWPGNAHLDFEKIVHTLREVGYDGFVSLEIFPWPDSDTAAQSSIRYLRQFIPKTTKDAGVRAIPAAG